MILKEFKNVKEKKSGVALLWTMVVIFVLLLIAGSMTGLIIKEMRMATNIDMSEQAYAAARSGIEVGRTRKCPSSGTDIEIDSTSGTKFSFIAAIDPADGKCKITSEGYAGPNQIRRKLTMILEEQTYTGQVMAFPDDAGGISEPTGGNGEPTKLSYFKDTGTVVQDGNIGGVDFYQQFDLTVPLQGTTAAVGTVNIQPPGTSATDYFIVGIENADEDAGHGQDKIVYKGARNGPPIMSLDGDVKTGLALSMGEVVRIKIKYASSNFAVTATRMSDNTCLGTLNIGSLSSYSFNNIGTYSSDTTIARKDTGLGIAINTGGLNIAYLKNMILTGTSANPQFRVAVGGTYSSGASVASNLVANCGAGCYQYPNDTQITLTPQNGADGAIFEKWSDNLTDNPRTVIISGSQTLTANFRSNGQVLTITPKPSNGRIEDTEGAGGTKIKCGTDGDDCTQAYSSGSVTLKAFPDSGYKIASWGGACSGTGQTCTVTMDAAKNASITFQIVTSYRITVTLNNMEWGYVLSTPSSLLPYQRIDCGWWLFQTNSVCSIDFAVNETVTLSPTDSAWPHMFASWGGDCTGGGGLAEPCILKMDSDKNVTATFN